jgi:ABC-type phosphate/phosphonate transport system substrate-binding protein
MPDCPAQKIMQADEFKYRLNYLLISLAIFAALVLFVRTYAEPVLRVSQMPDESPPVMRRKLKPLTDYLEKKIGMKMEFRPMSSGDALVEALIRHDLDLVWIDGISLARARSRSNDQVIPLVQREEVEKTRSEFTTAPGKNVYTWTVRADMDANLRRILTDAFLALNRNIGQDKAILELQRVERFIPADAENGHVTASSR